MKKQDTQKGVLSDSSGAGADTAPAAAGAVSGSMYAELLETVAEGVLIAANSGVVADMNSRAAELVHGLPETVRNRGVDDLFSDGQGPIMARVQDVVGREKEARLVLTVTGARETAQLAARVRRMPGGRHFCFFLSPYHGAAALPEEVSTAIGKISHDLENLLTPLYSYPEIIHKDLPASSRGARLLDVMERTAKDMGLIAQRLVALSKSGRSRVQVFSVNGPVRKVSELLAQGAAAKNIKLCVQAEEDLLPVKGSPEQILRVVQNLCKNAIDAISESGRIDIETSNVYVGTAPRGDAGLALGEYVRLRISDSGPGIPDEIREKIFEPYFTTKGDKGKGSGLGLSVVKDVVKEHGGTITVSSRVGHGATFDLHFPACRQDAPSPASRAKTSMDGLSAVVVDDDGNQREIISRLLTYHGYNTKCFQSGEEAVETFRQLGASRQACGAHSTGDLFPDVVFLDEEMGSGMDGKATLEKILETNPAQRVVMMLAGPAGRNASTGIQGDAAVRVSKPLTWTKIESAMELLHSSKKSEDPNNELTPCAGGRILIVDDEEGICKLFDMIISSAFPLVHTEVCGNGKDAVELFRKQHHSVILMDMHMPVLDGQGAFTAMQALCRESRWQMPSVIFCTGFAPPGAVERIVRDDRRHGILAKPVSREDLIGAVKKRLSF